MSSKSMCLLVATATIDRSFSQAVKHNIFSWSCLLCATVHFGLLIDCLRSRRSSAGPANSISYQGRSWSRSAVVWDNTLTPWTRGQLFADSNPSSTLSSLCLHAVQDCVMCHSSTEGHLQLLEVKLHQSWKEYFEFDQDRMPHLCALEPVFSVDQNANCILQLYCYVDAELSLIAELISKHVSG